jgi:hypothetical protein
MAGNGQQYITEVSALQALRETNELVRRMDDAAVVGQVEAHVQVAPGSQTAHLAFWVSDQLL